MKGRQVTIDRWKQVSLQVKPEVIRRTKLQTTTQALTTWTVKAQDFSQNTSLHGLRYVGDNSLHLVERSFWIVSFILAVLTAVYFISDLYNKWKDSPVIMSLSPSPTSLTSIAFPAITICNMNNAKRSLAATILTDADNGQPSLRRKLLNEICKFEQNKADAALENYTVEWGHYFNFMLNVSQPCHEMIAACFWHSERRSCMDLFNAALTDEGVCCTFNRLKRDMIFHYVADTPELNLTYPFESVNWTPELGYPEHTKVEDLPWRPWGAGSHLGLTLVLDAALDEYFCSSEVSIGFKVVLHNPVEVPKMSAFGSALPNGFETRMVVSPDLMTATEQTRSIPQHKRQCLFSEERNLRFFRTYTEHNCAQECEANVTLEFCNCVQFYMPKDSETRICSRQETACVEFAKKVMEQRLIDDRSNISSYLSAMGNFTSRESCGCLPGCFSVSYAYSQSSTHLAGKLDIRDDYLADRSVDYFQRNMAVLHVFLKNTQYTAKQRGVLFGFTEFLSNTGGLLGLFMGFSFLSAVEVVYFLTLRLWCSVHHNRAKNKRRLHPVVVAPYPFVN